MIIFWQNREIPIEILKYPERLTPQEILNEQNVEVRRIILERYGAENFIRNLGAKPVQEDKYGRLHRVRIPNQEDLVMVHVKDPSTDREYFLRVPPTMQSAHEAVAWTFGMRKEDYNPDMET